MSDDMLRSPSTLRIKRSAKLTAPIFVRCNPLLTLPTLSPKWCHALPSLATLCLQVLPTDEDKLCATGAPGVAMPLGITMYFSGQQILQSNFAGAEPLQSCFREQACAKSGWRRYWRKSLLHSTRLSLVWRRLVCNDLFAPTSFMPKERRLRSESMPGASSYQGVQRTCSS